MLIFTLITLLLFKAVYLNKLVGCQSLWKADKKADLNIWLLALTIKYASFFLSCFLCFFFFFLYIPAFQQLKSPKFCTFNSPSTG